jgi:hypothetical protein
LGNCYENGDGVYKNPGLALKLWRKCAQHVHKTENADGTSCYNIYSSAVAAAHYNIGTCYCFGSNGVEKDLPMAMQFCTKAADLGDTLAQETIGALYLMGFDGCVRVGTFDRDVPLGMKYLRALTVDDLKCISTDEAASISNAEALIRAFEEDRSCMGCGSKKARKLCSGCLYHADHTKVRYCGEACQLIHWRHQTASHKAECGSRAATRDSFGPA